MLYLTFLLIIASVSCDPLSRDRSWSIKRKYLTWMSDPYVKFYYYNRERRYDPEDMIKDYRNGSYITSFDSEKPLKITIHGWKGTNEIRFSKSIRDGILDNQDVDLISMDWSGYGSRQLYPRSRLNVPRVARLLASFLDHLCEERGVDLERVHILAHSLGAHIAGIAGRKITRCKIGRITGFDPAGIFFNKKNAKSRLGPSSANFVDVIHTCNDFIGLKTEMGHADFFPNGGVCWQPGCGFFEVLCSHRRSYKLYIQSISKQNLFPAIACRSWEDFVMDKNCDHTNIVNMGEELSPSARGSYYLVTTGEPPYGLGPYEEV